MSDFKLYKRKGLSEMRPYIPGEDLSKISVSQTDTPELGGMVARNPKDSNDQWYVAKQYFEDNLEEVIEQGTCPAPTGNLAFGLAIEALKQGKLVARKGWNGKGMFVFMRPSDTLSAATIINNVKSLPIALKQKINAEFSHSANEEKAGLGPENVQVTFTAYLCMKAADGSIVNGWLASQTDILAEDWEIIS